MNPLTLVKRIQKINSQEAALGISEEASWHAKYKGSAYVFVGGIPFDLTEGDLLAVFAQYGEIVDVNLVRDKGTGKSKGFAFVAYEDQRSTNLAVDNLNGAQILGRIIRVDHVSNYKKKEEEDEETERQKREARGVCRAFQRGECNRGAGCKFSHDEQRASNTGWGSEDKSSRWGHDKFQSSTKSDGKPNSMPTNRVHDPTFGEGHRFGDRSKGSDGGRESHHRRSELGTRDQDGKGLERQMDRKEKALNYKGERDGRATEKRSGRHDPNPSEEHDRRWEDQDTRGTERRSRRHDFELREDDSKEEDQDRRATERRSGRHDSNPSEDCDRRVEDQDARATERRSRRHDFESREDDSKEVDQDRRATERRSGRHDSNPSEDRDRRGEDQDTRATERRSRRQDFKSREDDRKEEDRDKRATERKSRKPEFESDSKDEHDEREGKRSRREEDRDRRATERKSRKPEFESDSKDEHDGREEKRSRRHELEWKPKEEHGRREEKQSRRHESESYQREDHRDERGGNKWSGHSRDTVSHRHRE